MFWLGELIALTAGLIGLAFTRRLAQLRWPSLRNRHLDVATVVLLLLGLGISAIIHVREVRKSEELEGTVSTLRDFSSVAALGPTGVTGMAGAGLKEETQISKVIEGAWAERNGGLFPSCDEQSLVKFRRAIEMFPRFPFSHYALAICLRGQGDSDWERHARSAVEILDKTTTLAAHHSSHDQARDELRRYLSIRP